MVNDWRFEKSPHVEVGGLRAYAGVPLKFETEFGQHVAFGSLCVASNSPEELLSPVVQQSLIRLADGIVSDIVHSARARRQKERRRMLELICDAQRHCDEHADMEQEIPKIVQEIYPGMEVVIRKTTDGCISLESGTTFSTCELEHGLWEDTDYFDYAIEHLNHLDMTAPRAVRAIAAQCASQTVPTFLVVACNDLKRIFDDVDSWFLQACAVSSCGKRTVYLTTADPSPRNRWFCAVSGKIVRFKRHLQSRNPSSVASHINSELRYTAFSALLSS